MFFLSLFNAPPIPFLRTFYLEFLERRLGLAPAWRLEALITHLTTKTANPRD